MHTRRFTPYLIVFLFACLIPLWGQEVDAAPPVVAPNNSTDLDYSQLFQINGNVILHDMATDNQGYIYLTGETYAGNFVTTSGAFNTESNGNTDAFVAKLNAEDGTLVYGTFLGGLNHDRAYGIAVDGNGYIYVIGCTASDNFPVTDGAYDTGSNGASDSFVVKLNPAGNGSDDLLYSSYLTGSSQHDCGHGIAVDTTGHIYATGYAYTFPTTEGAYDRSGNGRYDAYVFKLNPAGNGEEDLLYSTYIGGNLDDYGYAIAVDDVGDVYLAGSTFSTNNFPITSGAYMPNSSGDEDIFFIKLDPAGNGAQDLLYGTYLGGTDGNDGDVAYDLALDQANHVYLTGITSAEDFSITPNAFDSTLDDTDAFIVKLNPAGNGQADLLYGSYFGGTNYDQGQGITVDKADHLHITGYTKSTDLLTTPDAFQTDFNGGLNDIDGFFARLNIANGLEELIYSSYLGGGNPDYGSAIAVDDECDIYVAGVTSSIDFPGLNDEGGFLSKLATGHCAWAAPASLFVALTEEESITKTLTINNIITDTLSWTISEHDSVSWLTPSPLSGTVALSDTTEITVFFDATTLTPGTYTNTLTLNANHPSQPAIEIPITLLVKTPLAEQLSLTKSVSSPTALPGERVTYQIVLTTTDQALPVMLTDTLPAGLTYVNGSLTDGATFENGQIRYDGGVAPGTPLVIEYQAQVDNIAGGSILYNLALVTSGEIYLEAGATLAVASDFNQTLLLIYANGDNNLSDYMLDLINRAEKGAGNPNVVTLLLLDGPHHGDAYLYRLQEDFDGSCPNYANPTCDGRYQLGQDWWTWQENIGSPYSLANFLIGAQRAYPNARQLLLSMVGHGGGWAPTVLDGQPDTPGHGSQPGGPGGLLWDDHPGMSLSTAEFGQALRWAKEATGRKIDLLYLDACLMAMSEVAYEVHDSVDYLLASENWGWTSFAYDEHLTVIDGSITADEVGEAWLAHEADILRPDDYPFTYSLVDLSQMNALRTAMDALASAMINLLPTDKDKIDAAFAASACFDSNADGYIVQPGSIYSSTHPWTTTVTSIALPASLNSNLVSNQRS